MNRDDPRRYDAEIARALATPGGHLSIGRGGFCLHYDHTQLSGYDEEIIKQAAVDAGLPVIDSRSIPFDIAAKLVIRGPMIAVNQTPSPTPWHAFSYAPLEAVAVVYRKAGAEVFNIQEQPDHEVLAAPPPGKLSELVDFWLNCVCAQGA
jgi:hypothetical protein